MVASADSNGSKVFDLCPHHVNSTIVASIQLKNSCLVKLRSESGKKHIDTEWVILEAFLKWKNRASFYNEIKMR